MDAAVEQSLIARCVAGDMKAWQILVEQHHQSVFNLVVRLARTEEAEDITQEVFLRAFRALPGFRRESRLSTWLYRITVNLCRDLIRSRRRAVSAFSLDEPLKAEEGQLGRDIADPRPTPDERVEHNELANRIREALESLPEIHRTVLVLHDMQGLRYEEISQVVGCSLGTVKSRLFYGRRKLSELLADYVLEERS